MHIKYSFFNFLFLLNNHLYAYKIYRLNVFLQRLLYFPPMRRTCVLLVKYKYKEMNLPGSS